MRCIILGAAAGGGLPQWNCGCRNCADARAGRLRPMTQSSAAVSADGRRWTLLNASPDVRTQLAATPALAPATLRGSPIERVLLTNGDVDHVVGLLSLREKTPFEIRATAEIHAALAENPLMDALDPALVTREPMALGEVLELDGLRAECFAVPGKVPLWREVGDVATDIVSETTIGVILSAGGRRLGYVPGCAAVSDELVARLETVDLILFDGTVWENDEMPRLGVGAKTGRRMGHAPINGPDGSLARLAAARARKVYVHINNTNPILQPDAPERRRVEAAGWTVAQDGMEFRL